MIESIVERLERIDHTLTALSKQIHEVQVAQQSSHKQIRQEVTGLAIKSSETEKALKIAIEDVKAFDLYEVEERFIEHLGNEIGKNKAIFENHMQWIKHLIKYTEILRQYACKSLYGSVELAKEKFYQEPYGPEYWN